MKTKATKKREITTSDLQPGDFVLLERHPDDKGTDGKPLSAYDAGEFIVVSVGVFAINVVKSGSVYELHSPSTKQLAGPERWMVGAMSRSPEKLQDKFQSVLDECVAVLSGQRKPTWVLSVYDSAMANIQRICPCKPTSPGQCPGTATLTPPRIIYSLPENLKTGKHLLVNGVATSLPSGATVSYPV